MFAEPASVTVWVATWFVPRLIPRIEIVLPAPSNVNVLLPLAAVLSRVPIDSSEFVPLSWKLRAVTAVTSPVPRSRLFDPPKV